VGRFELDVVARRGPLVVAVEVRTRSARSFERALESIDGRKRARLLQAVDRLWRDHLKHNPGVERIRIDVAAVTFEGRAARIEYIEGAVTG
jgi:putative endonuclease